MVKLSVEQFNKRYYFSGNNNGLFYVIDKATGTAAYMLSGYLQNNSRIYPQGFGALDGGKVFFSAGVVCTASELFETLTDDEKEKVAWEINEWR